MRSRTAAVAVAVALAAVASSCGSEPGARDDERVAESPPTVGTLGNDPFVVRDALVERVRAAGGVRVSVSGRPSTTGLDLNYEPEEQGFARRFTWSADGQAMELMELATGRVCANLAAGRALESQGSSGMGYLSPSDLPYSCTTKGDDLGGFVVYGYAALDPVTRLAGLMGDVALVDLGSETDRDGLATRHVRLTAEESDRSLRPTPSTYDLWVDGDGRVVRAEFTSLDADHGPYVATFAWGDPPAVTLPPAAVRGGFVLHQGTGPGTVHPPATR